MDHTTLCFQISLDQLKTLTTTGRLNLDNKVLLHCEWSGTRSGPGSGPMFSGGDGDTVSCCAECGGINPSDPGRGTSSKNHGDIVPHAAGLVRVASHLTERTQPSRHDLDAGR